jgi:hypothetical protein
MPDETRNGVAHSEVGRGARAAILGVILGVVLVAMARRQPVVQVVK